MTAIVIIILALVLAWALAMLGSLGTFDKIAATVWADVKAVPASLLAGLKALGWLAVLAFAAMLIAVLLILAFGRWLWSRHPGTRIRRRFRRGNRYAGRHLACAVSADPCDANRPDHGDISEAEHEQAVTYLIRKYGKVPPSLQRVIDMGGRIGLPKRKQEATP